MGSDSIQIRISAVDDFSKVVGSFKKELTSVMPTKLEDAFGGVNGQVKKLKQEMNGFTQSSKTVSSEMLKHKNEIVGIGDKLSSLISGVAGKTAKEFTGLFKKLSNLYSNSISSGGSMTLLWRKHWSDVVNISLKSISSIASSINTRLGNALNSAAQGFQIGSQFGGVAAIAGGVLGGLASYLSGPSNQELMSQYGAEAGNIYGIAWSQEVAATMEAMAEILPKAGNGKNDYIAAMFHPETMKVALANLDEFGLQVQDKFAGMFENNVKPVLMNILKMSENEAATAMAPLFEQAIQKALEYGESLSPYMKKMFDWAKNMGVELNISSGKFAQGLQTIMEQTQISVEQFRNLKELAEQVGVDIESAFGTAMSGFIHSSDISIERLQGIAIAAREAGFDVSKSFTQALENSQSKIKDLRDQLQDMGKSALNWFLDKLNIKQQRRNHREYYLNDKARSAQQDWEDANSNRLDEINKLSGSEKEAALKRYNQEKEKAYNKGKQKSQVRYNELLKKANDINIDGKHDIRDIREAIKDLPEEEQKIVLELAKQKQERIAHRDEMKRQKELQKKIKTQIKAQKDLIKSINKLAENLGNNFDNASKNLPDSGGFADDMKAAYGYWRYMAENPLSAKVNNQKGSSGISAAKGVDLTLSGPPSGYHVPLTMHGTERLQITPANSISSPCNNNKTTIFNINPSMHVHSLDSQTLESWVRTKGLPMMAQQIRTELTPFDRTIVKGDV